MIGDAHFIVPKKGEIENSKAWGEVLEFGLATWIRHKIK